ncbi:MAG: carboxypeptidase regulatory-like domain-containing protein [Elusimicrobiota bacterium]
MKKINLTITALLLLSSSIYSYDAKNTHPYFLTAKAGDMCVSGGYSILGQYYNTYGDKTAMKFLTKGSHDEDNSNSFDVGEIPGFSWRNHFYNPVTGEGFRDTACRPSIEYAGDIWNAALWQYVKGNKDNAFYKLGRVVHLLQDSAAVPHVYLDQHAFEEEGYETWIQNHLEDDENIIKTANILQPAGSVYGSSSLNYDDFIKEMADKTYYAVKVFGDLKKSTTTPVIGVDMTNMFMPDVDQYGSKFSNFEIKYIKNSLDEYWVLTNGSQNYYYEKTLYSDDWWPIKDGKKWDNYKSLVDSGASSLTGMTQFYFEKPEAICPTKYYDQSSKQWTRNVQIFPLAKLWAGMEYYTATPHQSFKIISQAIGYSAGLIKFFLDNASNLYAQIIGTFYATVKDSITNENINGALIKIENSFINTEVTITDGVFSIDLPKGNYSYKIEDSEHQTYYGDVTITALQSTGKDIILTPFDARIYGTVKDQNGNVLEGVNVIIVPINDTNHNYSTVTNASGYYSIRAPNGLYNIYFSKNEYIPIKNEYVLISQGSETEININSMTLINPNAAPIITPDILKAQTNNHAIKIGANVVDYKKDGSAGGVKKVDLIYKGTNDSLWRALEMLRSENDYYDVNIPGQQPGTVKYYFYAEDTDGNGITLPYPYEQPENNPYSFDVVLDNTPPVPYPDPAPNKEGVETNTRVIKVSFNEAVDRTSINNNTLLIQYYEENSYKTLHGNINAFDNSIEFFISASEQLAPNTVYTCNLKGIKDLSGNTMPDYTWSFTVEDVLPIAITAVSCSADIYNSNSSALNFKCHVSAKISSMSIVLSNTNRISDIEGETIFTIDKSTGDPGLSISGNDITFNWDGKYNGHAIPDGEYVFKINAIDAKYKVKANSESQPVKWFLRANCDVTLNYKAQAYTRDGSHMFTKTVYPNFDQDIYSWVDYEEWHLFGDMMTVNIGGSSHDIGSGWDRFWGKCGDRVDAVKKGEGVYVSGGYYKNFDRYDRAYFTFSMKYSDPVDLKYFNIIKNNDDIVKGFKVDNEGKYVSNNYPIDENEYLRIINDYSSYSANRFYNNKDIFNDKYITKRNDIIYKDFSIELPKKVEDGLTENNGWLCDIEKSVFENIRIMSPYPNEDYDNNPEIKTWIQYTSSPNDNTIEGRLVIENQSPKVKPFIFDVTPPQIDMRVINEAFSYALGRSATFQFLINENFSGIKDVNLSIYDLANNLINTIYSAETDVPETKIISWNGDNSSGNKVNDGEYAYKIKARDGANNWAEKQGVIIVDTHAPEISGVDLKITPGKHKSPDSFSLKDSNVTISGALSENYSPLINAEISFISSRLSKPIVFTKQYDRENGVFENYQSIWDANDEKGINVPDGEYEVSIKLVDNVGNTEEYIIGAFEIDRTPSYILDLSISNTIIGDNEPLYIFYKLTEFAETEIRIIDQRRRTIRFYKDPYGYANENYIWDGNDMYGEPAESGAYTIQIKTLDWLENEAVSETSVIKNHIPAEIFFPMDDYSVVSSTVIIKGNALDPGMENTNDFKGYRLWWRQGEITSWDGDNDPKSPSQVYWHPITIPVINQSKDDQYLSLRSVYDGELGYFDISGIADGTTCAILLTAEDNSGDYSFDSRIIVVNSNEEDATSPFISITNPVINNFYTIAEGAETVPVIFNLVSGGNDTTVNIDIINTKNNEVLRHETFVYPNSGGINEYVFDWNMRNYRNWFVDTGEYLIRITAKDNDGYGMDIKEVKVHINKELGAQISILNFDSNNESVEISEPVTITYDLSKIGISTITVKDVSSSQETVILRSESNNGSIEWSSDRRGLYLFTLKTESIDNPKTYDEASIIVSVGAGLGSGSVDIIYPQANALSEGSTYCLWKAQAEGLHYPDEEFTCGIKASGMEYPYEDFTWTVTGTGTETWYSSQSVSKSGSGGGGDGGEKRYDKKIIRYNGRRYLVLREWWSIINVDYGITYNNTPTPSLSASGSIGGLEITETRNNGFKARVYLYKDIYTYTGSRVCDWLPTGGPSGVTFSWSVTGNITVSNTATRSKTVSGSGRISKIEGDRTISAFNAYPPAPNGGAISNVSYSISDNSSNVSTWISGNIVKARGLSEKPWEQASQLPFVGTARCNKVRPYVSDNLCSLFTVPSNAALNNQNPFSIVSGSINNSKVNADIRFADNYYRLKAMTNNEESWNSNDDLRLNNGQLEDIYPFNNTKDPYYFIEESTAPIFFASGYLKTTPEQKDVKAMFWRDGSITKDNIYTNISNWNVAAYYPDGSVNDSLHIGSIKSDFSAEPIANDDTFDYFSVKLTTGDVPVKTFIEIKGSAYGDGFKGYSIFYKKPGDTVWNLICAKNEQVYDGVLGYWDVRGLHGEYKLKVVMLDNTGASEKEITSVIGKKIEANNWKHSYVCAPYNKAYIDFPGYSVFTDTVITVTPRSFSEADIKIPESMPMPIGAVYDLKPHGLRLKTTAQFVMRFLEDEMNEDTMSKATLYHVKDEGFIEPYDVHTVSKTIEYIPKEGGGTVKVYKFTIPINSFSSYLMMDSIPVPEIKQNIKLTNKNSVILEGKAVEPNSKIEIISQYFINTVYADANGNFSYEIKLAEGKNKIRARQLRYYKNEELKGKYSNEIEVVLDSKAPIISGMSLISETFTPDGDGDNDTALMSYFLNEDANLEIKVKDIYGHVIRILDDASGIKKSGQNNISWGGYDANLALASSGEYRIVITAQDTAGNKSMEIEKNIKLVSKAECSIPDVKITAPYNNGPVTDKVFILAEVSNECRLSKVEFYVDDVLLNTDADPVYCYEWDSSACIESSTHTIKIIAYNKPGTETFTDKIIVRKQGNMFAWRVTAGGDVSGSWLEEASISISDGKKFIKDIDVAVTPETVLNLEIFHADVEGFLEGNKLYARYIDRTGPSFEITEPKTNSILSGTVDIKLGNILNHIVIKTFVYVDGKKVLERDGLDWNLKLDTTLFYDGEHTIDILIYDIQNQYYYQTIKAKFDNNILPENTITINVLSPQNNYNYITFKEDIIVNYSVYDNLNNDLEIKSYINDYETGNFVMQVAQGDKLNPVQILHPGKWQYTLEAKDYSGNISSYTAVFNVIGSSIPAKSGLAYDCNEIEIFNKVYLPLDNSIRIEILNDDSAESYCEYSIDDCGFIRYTGAFSIPQGLHKLSYYCVKDTYNVEKTKTLDIIVGRKPDYAILCPNDELRDQYVWDLGNAKDDKTKDIIGNRIAPKACELIDKNNFGMVYRDYDDDSALAAKPVYEILMSNNNNDQIPKTDNGKNPLYGVNNFVLSNGDSIILEKGTYYFNDIILDDGASLKTNGRVNIICAGRLSISEYADSENLGQFNDIVIFIADTARLLSENRNNRIQTQLLLRN